MATSQAQLRGFALPAIRTAGGYFASKGPDDIAWGNLITAAFTPVGSRPMRRAFGSVLHEMVFEPNDADVQEAVSLAITDAVKRWASGVVVRAVRTQSKNNTLSVMVEFSRSDDRSRALTSPMVRLSKSDVVNLIAASRPL